MHLIGETLSELGDLTTKGTKNGAVGKVNLDTTRAREWFRVTNPITYRSFSQTFAKNLYQNLNVLSDCNGVTYEKDKIETLLDDYGLLIFRTYNQNRNFSDPNTAPNTLVSSSNRKKSIMISKNLIKLDPTPNATSAFVIDSQSQIADVMRGLQASGVVAAGDLFQTPNTFPYNNGNGRISPGEVIALSPNMYNDSNATMGGVQVLASDWDHVSPAGSPYVFDQWPLVSEGGVTAPTSATANFVPVCLIQSQTTDGTATKWITQKAFRQKVAVDQSMCLDNTNDKDCFIRAIKGTEQATFSKILPKKTFTQSMQDPNTTTPHSPELSNVIMFQVSKHTPPGTVVYCRLRARFTNCEDCYHDATRSNYDFKDLDYNGATPFKIISLQFSITD
jgi:hypothetical protein